MPRIASIAEARPVSRPRFARRVRGRRALTLAFAPRLSIQLSGGCQIFTSTNRALRRVESLSEEIWDLRKTCSNKHSPTNTRIITYSDLHLEFGSGWMLPPAVNGDVMILAGDIVTLSDYEPLDQILRKWKKPVLYVTGNHEYYTRRPMNEEECRFKAWLEDRHQHVKLLLDEEVSIGGVNFFGGTMWTDFNGGDLRAMETARSQMNDYRLIYNADEMPFTPADSIALHKSYSSKLLN